MCDWGNEMRCSHLDLLLEQNRAVVAEAHTVGLCMRTVLRP